MLKRRQELFHSTYVTGTPLSWYLYETDTECLETAAVMHDMQCVTCNAENGVLITNDK